MQEWRVEHLGTTEDQILKAIKENNVQQKRIADALQSIAEQIKFSDGYRTGLPITVYKGDF